MKKIILLLACAMFAAPLWAQIDSAAIQRQQQELLMQQQQAQQELMKQQQKELEQRQKEQEKELKDQAREQQREQEALMKKQAQQIKRMERRNSHDRHFYLSLNPYYGHTLNSNFLKYNDPYHSSTYFWRGWSGDLTTGADVIAHFPINQHWNFDMGVGYGLNHFAYTNDVCLNSANDNLMLRPQAELTAIENQYHGWLHHIEVPLLLSHCSTTGDSSWKENFIGVIVGYNCRANLRTRTWDANNEGSVSSVGMLPVFNQFEVKVVLGTMKKKLFFSPGTYLYVNLMPTYIDPDHKVYEAGIVYHL